MNLLEIDRVCLMEKPLHVIAKSKEVTNIFLVPISMEIKVPTRIPQLKIIGVHVNERICEIAEKKEHRLLRRANTKEMNGHLMDRLLCDFDSTRDNNELIMESYVVIKMLVNEDDYFIQYQSQGYSDDFSFHGDRSYNYHLGFEFEKKEMMLLSEVDFHIYCKKQPWKINSRDLCSLCCHPSIVWKMYPCKHSFCSSKPCIEGLENNMCIFKFKHCRVLFEKEAIVGYVDDGFCNYDDCMERRVINLPCQCFTCEGNGKFCSRCDKKVDEQFSRK